jgi:hypothetical protein
MLRTRALLAIAVGLALSSGGVARAEGPGIKLGDRLVLHPGIAAEFRYDSNVFFERDNPEGAFAFRALASLDLATRPPQRSGNLAHGIDFRLHLGGDYTEYITTDASLSQHRAFGVQGGLLLSILPMHPFSIDIFDNYVRTSQPPYLREPFNIDRDTNEVGVRFRYAPGGRRLTFDLSYAFGIDFFEVQQFKDLDVMYHRVNFRAAWKFFPKTAVYIDVTEQPYLYPHPGATMHPDSYPLRAIAGLQGLLTSKLTMNLWAGYGNGFYVNGPSPNTGVAGVDLAWKPIFSGTGGLGYRHDFVNSLLGSFYDLDTVYIGWTQMIWRFVGSLRLQYSNIRYQGIPPTAALTPPTTRTDDYIRLNARLDYPFKDFLIGSFGYDLQWDGTDSMLAATGAPGIGLIGIGYLKHEVWLRFSVLY